jgi:hypothetical protein
MKKINYTFSLLMLCGCMVWLTSCGDDDVKLNEQQQATKALSEGSPWHVTEVLMKPNEEVDETPLKSLQLTFGVTGSGASIRPGSFTATGADNFLSAGPNATWTWPSSFTTSRITLTEAMTGKITDVEFTPSIENPTSIKLTFERPIPTGRTKALVGGYTIVLE